MAVDADEQFRREMNARSEQRAQKAQSRPRRNKMIQGPGAAKGLQIPGRCPYCGVEYTTSSDLPAGSPLQCHRCRKMFPKGS